MSKSNGFMDRLLETRDKFINWSEENVPKKNGREEARNEPFINTRRSLGYFISGKKGVGKSAYGAHLGEKYYKAGHLVFDCFSARDFENCYWVIKEKREYPCIFILPRYAKAEIPEKYKSLVKVMYDDMGLEKILKTAHNEKRIVVFVNSIYEREHSLAVLAGFLNDAFKVNEKLNIDIFMIFRELSFLAPQNLKLYDNAKLTKRALMGFVVECRHHRFSFTMDMQFLTMLFKHIRGLYDRIVIKKTTPDLIPGELQWFLNQLKMNRSSGANYKAYPPVYKLFNNEYYGVYDSGLFFKDTFPLPAFHLKREKDSFRTITGITFSIDKKKLDEVLYGKKEITVNPLDVRTYKTSLKLKKKGMKSKERAELLGFPSAGALRTFDCEMKKKTEQSNT